MTGILDGIRILEWAIHHVAPYAGACMADLGAEVIKIEEPGVGDPWRGWSTQTNPSPRNPDRDWGYGFEYDNRHKKSIVLDLKQPAGREIAYCLAAKSDVFLTSARRPAALKLGMDRATLLGYNPRLIYVHVSGLGDKGEEAGTPGFGGMGDAKAGNMLDDVSPGAEPSRGGLGDQMGGISTVYGILAALLARERLGIAQEVNTSILGGVYWAKAMAYTPLMFDESVVRPVGTRENPVLSAIMNHYKAKDGKWLVINALEPTEVWWQMLCKLAGLEELIDDPRFQDRPTRKNNRRELVRILDQAFAQRDRDEWVKLFKEQGFPGAAINTPVEAINDSQAIANEYVVEYDHPYAGKVKYAGCPAQFSETPAQVRGVAPRLGEHTTSVLRELAGYSLEELEALRKQGVIR